MAADEITQRHLQRLRIRGAPATIPGSIGFVGNYDAEETWRQTGRALVTPLGRPISARALWEASVMLKAMAEQQKLQVVEDPLFVLKGDPDQDPPHKWEYEAVLPIRGAGKAEGDVSVMRIQGGMHIFTMTPRGLGDLKHVYNYMFGKFLPSKKQQLMRPYILHRIVEGLDDEHAHDDKLTVAVYVPAVLSIKPVASEEGAV